MFCANEKKFICTRCLSPDGHIRHKYFVRNYQIFPKYKNKLKYFLELLRLKSYKIKIDRY